MLGQVTSAQVAEIELIEKPSAVTTALASLAFPSPFVAEDFVPLVAN